jgi:hypothetical protein
MGRRRRRWLLGSLVAILVVVLAPGALAHEERESKFPEGDGEVPTYRTIDEAADVVVVCKPDSADRIAEISDPDLRAFNEGLLEECAFEHIQEAVFHVRDHGVQETNLYVLPGLYLEEPTREAECAQEYDGGVVEYEDLYRCPQMIALVGIAGDTPGDGDDRCDNALCHLQLEGTGERPDDVVLRGGFDDDGDWILQHNGIKADRADGIYIRNLTTELFRENSIYVHETMGYVLDRTVTRYNDLYGILTFTSDRGLIKDCEAHHNGDSGIYPGSSADVNEGDEEPATGGLERWAVEITGCRSYNNALGHSGSGGNSIYAHGNEFFANGAGFVVDSFVPDHPGMPQDHFWLTDNRIYGNNVNYYERYVHSGICDRPPAERGYEDGTVCPAFPVPVGTGVMIAGGNHNLLEENLIYDNWRSGAMLFWIPAVVREELDPTKQYDTSNYNAFVGNTMGLSPDGLRQPNGLDFWWDDQGVGNCWQDNTSTGSDDGSATHNAVDPRGLPDCDSGGSEWVVGNPVKSAGLVPCATYDREDNPDPPGCDWFETPPEPEGRETGTADDEATGDPSDGDIVVHGAADGGSGSLITVAVASTPATGGGALLVAVGLLAIALVAARRARPGPSVGG